METPRFGIACTGYPCDVIGLSRDSHCHMPPQDTQPNYLSVHPEAAQLATQLLKHSYDGRIGDEDTAWESHELERLFVQSNFIGSAATTAHVYMEVS